MARPIALLLTLLAIAISASTAHAFTIIDLATPLGNPASDTFAVGFDASDAGNSFEIQWGLADPSLSATASFTVTSYADDEIVLDIMLENTTDLAASGLSNAAILAMGFGVYPDVGAVLSSAGSVFADADTGFGSHQQFAGGFKGIDVCIFADACSGGDVKLGLQAGEKDSFQVTLTPRDTGFGDGVTLAWFPIKFQTSDGSFELPGRPVPEPSAALAFAVGGLVVSAAVRRSRRETSRR